MKTRLRLRSSVVPSNDGVRLVRAGVLQPTATTNLSSVVAFDASGKDVYGLDTETTGFGLRRMAVLPDGLEEQAAVSADDGFNVGTMDYTPRGLVVGRAVYRTPDLLLAGQANVEGGRCRAHTVPNRLVCSMSTNWTLDGMLAVVDATTFAIVSTPAFRRGEGAPLISLVPGPAGQVAIRTNASTSLGQKADKITLFDSTALQ